MSVLRRDKFGSLQEDGGPVNKWHLLPGLLGLQCGLDSCRDLCLRRLGETGKSGGVLARKWLVYRLRLSLNVAIDKDLTLEWEL